MSLFFPVPEKAVGACLRAGWVALVLALSGCGPGTGGTGNGDTAAALDAYGAKPANVCTNGPSSALVCTPSGGSGTSVLNPGNGPGPLGTEPVLFSSTGQGNNVVLRLHGNYAELEARCLDLRFEGEWGLVGQNDKRFFGYYTDRASPASRLASLWVQVAGSDNKSLNVQLLDPQGRVVLGTVLLRPVPSPVSNPDACPP